MTREGMRYLSLATLLVTVGAGCAKTDGPVVFGSAGKWDTGYGTMSRRGIELAVEELNRDGGINNRVVEVHFKNDQASGVAAAAVADSFVNDVAVSAVIGHLSSGAMVAAAKVYAEGKLPALATTATSPDLTGISPYVFRVVPSDSASGVELARFAKTLGRTKAAILYENDAYGRGLADAFKRGYEGTVLLTDPIGTATRDFDVHLAYFKKLGIDLVFVAGTEGTGIVFLQQARKAAFIADFVGGDGWAPVVDTPEAEGAYVGVPFSALDPRAASQTFVSAFKMKHKVVPDNNAALGYDATMLLARAVRTVGTDRAKIRDYLASGASYEGATGTIRLGANGDPIGKGISITRVKSGALELAGAK